MRKKHLRLAAGEIDLPIFLPDATQGVVRSVDAEDLRSTGVQALVMNTFHLMQHPGSATIQALGGLHRMSGWTGPIVTDSGGFQAYSLIHQNPKFGSLSPRGITFQPEGSERKYLLTPEKCIQLQFSYGADVFICLDDCTHVDASLSEQQNSVQRTVAWARRSKHEYERLLDGKNLFPEQRPLLFAVVQGGGFPDLRRECAEALLEIGFDGFGYGGWPLDAQGNLLTEMITLTRQLIPPEFPMHALGIGHPENLLSSYETGYDLFDSAMPTRDARHGRLYTFEKAASGSAQGLNGEWLSYLYVGDKKHIRVDRPVSEYCDCPCCRRYSLGYLHHLFKIKDTLYFRLATMHNLRFMSQLTERIRRREHAD